jgi:hypothetical protein
MKRRSFFKLLFGAVAATLLPNIPLPIVHETATNGFFRATFMCATSPTHPEYGYVILHHHCPPLYAT